MRRSAHIIWSRCHFVFFIQCLISLPVTSGAQETKCNITGIIRSVTDPFVHGATITVIHQSTKNRFISVSRQDGRFYFTGLANAENARGSETTISRRKMESLPTISRNLQDYIRLD